MTLSTHQSKLSQTAHHEFPAEMTLLRRPVLVGIRRHKNQIDRLCSFGQTMFMTFAKKMFTLTLVVTQLCGNYCSASMAKDPESGPILHGLDIEYYVNLLEQHPKYGEYKNRPEVSLRLSERIADPAVTDNEFYLRLVVEFAAWRWGNSAAEKSEHDILIAEHFNQVIKPELLESKDERFALRGVVTWTSAQKKSKVVIAYGIHKSTGEFIFPRVVGALENVKIEQLTLLPGDRQFKSELMRLDRIGAAGIWQDQDSKSYYLILPQEQGAQVTKLRPDGQSEDVAVCRYSYSGSRLVNRSGREVWTGEIQGVDRISTTHTTRLSNGRLHLRSEATWKKLSAQEVNALVNHDPKVKQAVEHKIEKIEAEEERMDEKKGSTGKETLMAVGVVAALGIALYAITRKGRTNDGGREPSNAGMMNVPVVILGRDGNVAKAVFTWNLEVTCPGDDSGKKQDIGKTGKGTISVPADATKVQIRHPVKGGFPKSYRTDSTIVIQL